jgi:hypothetical protein
MSPVQSRGAPRLQALATHLLLGLLCIELLGAVWATAAGVVTWETGVGKEFDTFGNVGPVEDTPDRLRALGRDRSVNYGVPPFQVGVNHRMCDDWVGCGCVPEGGHGPFRGRRQWATKGLCWKNATHSRCRERPDGHRATARPHGARF